MSPAGDYNRCYVAPDYEPDVRRVMEELNTWRTQRSLSSVMREYDDMLDRVFKALGGKRPPLTNRHDRKSMLLEPDIPGWIQGILDEPNRMFACIGVTPDFVPSVNRLALVPLLQMLTPYPLEAECPTTAIPA